MHIEFPEVHVPVQGLDRVKLPNMVTVHQAYDRQKVEDLAGTVRSRIVAAVKNPEEYRGKRIAITAGSRGIPDSDVILRTMCELLKEWGASPFIVPAMGSHGGATAEGQKEMLAGYHITEETMGVPVLSSMEVVQYDTFNGIPLYCDKYAFESDGIVIFNKVKPHTDFRGKHESGLAKMIAIGIAKHAGAAMFHSFGFSRFAELIPGVAEKFIATGKLAFGLGVVQNAYDDICTVEACTAENFMETDAYLLVQAKERMAKFKFDDIDLLIIDEIGKNISGNGHDPNVVGRNISRSFTDVLRLQKLFVRSITPESHGSGCGLSCADMTTRACLNSVDWEVTWANCMTTGLLDSGVIPIYSNTDKEAIAICLQTCHNIDRENPRVARIKNTLEMETVQVSEALYASIKDMEGISFVSGPEPMRFTDDGTLV